MSYRIEYSQEAIDHLRKLTARQRATIFEAVDAQLPYEPTLETRNRKLMRPNPLAVFTNFGFRRCESIKASYVSRNTPDRVSNPVRGILSHESFRIPI